MATTITTRVSSAASGGSTKRVTGAASGGATNRVTGAITEDITRRVSVEVIDIGNFLFLEGDSSGLLAMEGDDTAGFLKLQGTY